jgi:hypothetical protein
MDRTSKANAVHVETGSQGAVFRIEFEADGAIGPLDLQRRYQQALNEVDAFCQSHFDDEYAGMHSADIEQFDDWSCDEFGTIPFKYQGLGSDRSEFVIIIADRWLAASFKNRFCSPPAEPIMGSK